MVVKNSPRIISPRYFFKNEKNHFIGVITNPPVFNKRLEFRNSDENTCKSSLRMKFNLPYRGQIGMEYLAPKMYFVDFTFVKKKSNI